MRSPRAHGALVLIVLALSWAPAALADVPLSRAGELPRLEAKAPEGQVALPLKHTDVRAEVAGFVARVEVTQTWGNPFRDPIEAVYVFPLPDNSAVDGFRLVVGSRVIEAEIQKREDARRTFEQARRAGHTAALLEQERPNIFTQSITNLAPGEEIRVTTRYVQTLAYDEGGYEFVFPVVVGPRYMPGEPLPGPQSGTGRSVDTSIVRDASRISPSYLAPGTRSGHDLSLTVTVDAGLPIREYSVPTHEVLVDRADERRLAVRLSALDAIPNRDFVLRWAVSGELPQATLLTHRDERAGFFTLVVQPPALDVDRLVGDREFIFVVDSSGSMNGLPLWLCQQAMRDALRRLRPHDTFNLITFSGGTAQAFPAPRRASEANVADAMAFVAGMAAGGGTVMMNAVDAALRPEVEPGRARYVFFLTDGFVGNDEQIVAATRAYVAELERKGQRGRVFSFGVGSSPNRNLLEGIARSGRGAAVYASNREDPVRGVVRFFRLVDHPILEDVSVDWGGLPVAHVHPSPMPDLLLSRPLILHGRYEAAAKGRVVVRGYAGGKKVELPLRVALPGERHGSPSLASLWARAQIGDLLADLAFRKMSGRSVNEAAVEETVTGLGLAHRLVSPYTSFVAVDRSRRVGSGEPMQVAQPVEVPEDVDPVMSGAWAGQAGRSGLLGFRGTGAGGAGYGVFLGGASGVAAGDGLVLGGLRSKGSEGGREAAPPRPTGSVSEAGPTIAGPGDPRIIHAVVKRHRNQLRYCYEIELQRDPKLAGTLVLRLVIAADGSVREARIVGSALRSPALEACLLTRARRWKFPTPVGGGEVTVSYPLTFKVDQ